MIASFNDKAFPWISLGGWVTGGPVPQAVVVSVTVMNAATSGVLSGARVEITLGVKSPKWNQILPVFTTKHSPGYIFRCNWWLSGCKRYSDERRYPWCPFRRERRNHTWHLDLEWHHE